MVLEYLSGGEMLEHLHQLDHYGEAQACMLFRQVGRQRMTSATPSNPGHHVPCLYCDQHKQISKAVQMLKCDKHACIPVVCMCMPG